MLNTLIMLNPKGFAQVIRTLVFRVSSSGLFQIIGCKQFLRATSHQWKANEMQAHYMSPGFNLMLCLNDLEFLIIKKK